MKKLSMALLGGLLSFTALGQDLLQCVDPDVVNGLVFSGRSDRQLDFTATVPEILAGFEAPAGFTLVGTAAREGTSGSTVAYRTARNSADADAAFIAALAAAGWEEEDDSLTGMSRPIFTLADGATPRRTVCRDGARVAVRLIDVDGTRYPTINIFTAEERPRACHAEDRQLASIRMRTEMLTEGMPTLQFPPGTSSATPDGTLETGGGSSGSNYSTTVQVRSSDQAASLLDHFGLRISVERAGSHVS
jgi:hypothetical protein